MFLALGERVVGFELAKKIVDTFIENRYDENSEKFQVIFKKIGNFGK